jgi:hypothetical protein
MDFKEIQELLKLINRLDLSEFKMKDGEFELSIRTKNYERMLLLRICTRNIILITREFVSVMNTLVNFNQFKYIY